MNAAAAIRDAAGRLVTPRLRLRQWIDADRAPFAAMGLDPEVMTHFPRLLRRGESNALITREQRTIAATGLGFWAVERLADDRFIGFTGIRPFVLSTPIHGETEIGWRLAREFWGMGYALEAARAALHVAFVERGLPSVVAMTVVANTRSQRVMERLGMTRRADLDFEHPNLPPGHPLRPHIVYAMDNANIGD